MHFATTLIVALSLAYGVLPVPLDCGPNIPFGHVCKHYLCETYWPDHDPVYNSPPGWVPDAAFPNRDGAFVLPMPVAPFATGTLKREAEPAWVEKVEGDCCRWNWECYKFIVGNAVNLVSDKSDWETRKKFNCCYDRYQRSCSNPSQWDWLTIAPPDFCANPEPRIAV